MFFLQSVIGQAVHETGLIFFPQCRFFGSIVRVGPSQGVSFLLSWVGDSVAAAQLSWPRNQEGHNESGQQTGDENNHDNDVADCWQEIDELHSDSEGELSQNTSGSDRGNRGVVGKLAFRAQ